MYNYTVHLFMYGYVAVQKNVPSLPGLLFHTFSPRNVRTYTVVVVDFLFLISEVFHHHTFQVLVGPAREEKTLKHCGPSVDVD